MRKGLLLILSLFAINSLMAQDFCTLKEQADKFRVKGKHKKAAKLYDKAIERVATFQENVNWRDWGEIGVAAYGNELSIDKIAKTLPAFVKYGGYGESFNNKIKELKAAGTRCIFTYRILPAQTEQTFLTRDHLLKKDLFHGSLYERKLLVWGDKGQMFMQAFDNFNVYQPVKITDLEMIDICLDHYNEFIAQKVLPYVGKGHHYTGNEFNIYQRAGTIEVKKFQDVDVAPPQKPEFLNKFTVANYKTDSLIYIRNSTVHLSKLYLKLRAEWNNNFPFGK